MRSQTRAAVAAAVTTLALAACTGEEPSPQPTGATSAAPSGDPLRPCRNQRPYAASSPWNAPIAPGTPTHPESGRWIGTLASLGKPLSTDVDQYTIVVHCISAAGARSGVDLSGYYSDYTSGRRRGHGESPQISGVPVPRSITAGAGTDKQLVLWDQERHLEYGFWQFKRQKGALSASNGYVTRTDERGTGVFADGKAGRGAGFTYLSGLVTPEEVAAGRIEHALAFAYRWPAPSFLPPASKSDGRGHPADDLPEGARLQLDPSLTPQRLKEMGLSPKGIVIARALQEYGMYVVDNSGSSKVYLEDRRTAGWSKDVDRHLLKALPWSAFRVLQAPGGASPTTR